MTGSARSVTLARRTPSRSSVDPAAAGGSGSPPSSPQATSERASTSTTSTRRPMPLRRAQMAVWFRDPPVLGTPVRGEPRGSVPRTGGVARGGGASPAPIGRGTAVAAQPTPLGVEADLVLALALGPAHGLVG